MELLLIDPIAAIAGFSTLSTAQGDFSDLPPGISPRLPRRSLPVAIPAWLGVHSADRGRGLGPRLLAQVPRDSSDAGQTFVAVMRDCINDEARTFDRRWDFLPLPGHNNRLFLSWSQLLAVVTDR